MNETDSKNLTAHLVIKGAKLPTLDIPVTATLVVIGALASRDWRPMHHDKDFAVNRNGVRDIFINTPNNAAWFERYVTDWTGPKGRLGRMKFRMNTSVFPGDHMKMSGKVLKISTDATDCCWVDLDLRISVDGQVSTSCQARVAIPTDIHDNPWSRKADQWQP